MSASDQLILIGRKLNDLTIAEKNFAITYRDADNAQKNADRLWYAAFRDPITAKYHDELLLIVDKMLISHQNARVAYDHAKVAFDMACMSARNNGIDLRDFDNIDVIVDTFLTADTNKPENVIDNLKNNNNNCKDQMHPICDNNVSNVDNSQILKKEKKSIGCFKKLKNFIYNH